MIEHLLTALLSSSVLTILMAALTIRARREAREALSIAHDTRYACLAAMAVMARAAAARELPPPEPHRYGVRGRPWGRGPKGRARPGA